MLTGQAKKDYQRGYMRDYMRTKRGNVKTPVKTHLEAKGLTVKGNRLGITQRTQPDTEHIDVDADGNPIYEY